MWVVNQFPILGGGSTLLRLSKLPKNPHGIRQIGAPTAKKQPLAPSLEEGGLSSREESPSPVIHVEKTAENLGEIRFISYNISHYWVGFLRAEKPHNKSRHYRAKCDTCSVILSGKPPDLRAHKDKCLHMPEDVRKIVSVLKEPSGL